MQFLFSIFSVYMLYTWDYSEKEPYQQLRNYRFERSDVKEDIEYLKEQEIKFFECIEKKQKPDLILPEI